METMLLDCTCLFCKDELTLGETNLAEQSYSFACACPSFFVCNYCCTETMKPVLCRIRETNCYVCEKLCNGAIKNTCKKGSTCKFSHNEATLAVYLASCGPNYKPRRGNGQKLRMKNYDKTRKQEVRQEDIDDESWSGQPVFQAFFEPVVEGMLPPFRCDAQTDAFIHIRKETLTSFAASRVRENSRAHRKQDLLLQKLETTFEAIMTPGAIGIALTGSHLYSLDVASSDIDFVLSFDMAKAFGGLPSFLSFEEKRKKVIEHIVKELRANTWVISAYPVWNPKRPRIEIQVSDCLSPLDLSIVEREEVELCSRRDDSLVKACKRHHQMRPIVLIIKKHLRDCSPHEPYYAGLPAICFYVLVGTYLRQPGNAFGGIGNMVISLLRHLVSFPYKTTGISMERGYFSLKDTSMDVSDEVPLFVEDPAQRNVNCASSVESMDRFLVLLGNALRFLDCAQ